MRREPWLDVVENVVRSVNTVMVGAQGALELLLAALVAGGHVLVEDVPGVGKTTLVKTLARSLGCAFSRIQFTPDVLPTDVTGVSVYDPQTGEFRFRAGPLNANLVLADEINRASPKTQSALLEAMEERQVTVDGVTRPLPEPFMVIATQNPVEHEGTFPLPEAQLDRFLLCVRLGYPDPEGERVLVMRMLAGNPLEDVKPVAGPEQVLELRETRRRVKVDASVVDYVNSLVRATREHGDVVLGASPRAAVALARAAQALALVRGRLYVVPDDVKAAAVPVLSHRLVLKPLARVRGQTGEGVVGEVLAGVPVPV